MMPKIYIILLSLSLLFANLLSSAQELNTKYTLSSQFLFNNFQSGVVDYKTGNNTRAYLNYNVLLEQIQFIKNGQILSVSNTDEINAIKLGSKIFIPVRNKFYELVHNDSISILLRRFPELSVLDEREGGYGVKQNTASTDKLESYTISMGGITNTQNINTPRDNQKEIPISDKYYILFKGKMEAVTIGRIAKLLNVNKKEIKSYVKTNKLQLSKLTDLKQLIKHLNDTHLH